MTTWTPEVDGEMFIVSFIDKKRGQDKILRETHTRREMMFVWPLYVRSHRDVTWEAA